MRSINLQRHVNSAFASIAILACLNTEHNILAQINRILFIVGENITQTQQKEWN